MVGSRLRLVHSQIGDSEPREIWPGLTLSGARSTSSGSSGWKKNGDGLAARAVWPLLPNSVRSSPRMTSKPGVSSPHIFSRSISESRRLRVCDVSCRRYVEMRGGASVRVSAAMVHRLHQHILAL